MRSSCPLQYLYIDCACDLAISNILAEMSDLRLVRFKATSVPIILNVLTSLGRSTDDQSADDGHSNLIRSPHLHTLYFSTYLSEYREGRRRSVGISVNWPAISHALEAFVDSRRSLSTSACTSASVKTYLRFYDAALNSHGGQACVDAIKALATSGRGIDLDVLTSQREASGA